MLKIRLRHAPRAGAPLVVPVAEGGAIPAAARAAAGIAGFRGKAGEACEMFGPGERMLLVGLGTAVEAERAGALASVRLAAEKRIVLDARGLSPAAGAAFAAGAVLRAWRFDRRGKRDREAPRLAAVDLLVDRGKAPKRAWRAVEAGLRGAIFARSLVAEPANRLTPEDFCDRLEALEEHGIGLEVLRPKALARHKLGGLIAVGGGSENAPRLAVLRWKGSIDAPPVAFIGKGITFDTGGVCIKPAHLMWEMKGDMGGAAACAGAMLALALRGSPAPAVAVLPLAENATGPASYRPADVLRLGNGSTVEVVDTDAEGRLVLADALAWTAAQCKPQAMIDVATLTGSIITALGPHMAGLYANDAALAAQLAAAGQEVGERLWPMPIGESHREAIKSEIADLRHCVPERHQPDACIAAAFLREFAGDIPWAHLDIAGLELRATADDRHAAGATGFGARLLDRLVALRFEDPQ